MYHSITFGTKNTWDDWHLIPSSRPMFSPPPLRESFIEIPGADGALDLTETLTGYPVYGTRSGSFEFIVANGYATWSTVCEEIMSYLHGKSMKAVLEDDKSYYYEGRFTVNQWQSSKQYSTVTINYVVQPYKKEIISSLERWKWDPFNFEVGVIRNYMDIQVDGERTIQLIGSQQHVVPAIIVSDQMELVFEDETYTLDPGANVIPTVLIAPGENLLTFKGTGTVNIDYRGGKL